MSINNVTTIVAIAMDIFVGIALICMTFDIFIRKWKNRDSKRDTKSPRASKDDTTERTLRNPDGVRVPSMILSDEEIADIHKRGLITPAEKVAEWESMGLCAPGDAIGSAGWRCQKFASCRDCLNDYASSKKEHYSFFKMIKELGPMEPQSMFNEHD